MSSSGADVDQWRSRSQQADQARLAAEAAKDAAQNSAASKDAQVAQLTQANTGLQQQLDSVKHQLQSSQAAAQQALNSQQAGRAGREQARAEPAPAGVLEMRHNAAVACLHISWPAQGKAGIGVVQALHCQT